MSAEGQASSASTGQLFLVGAAGVSLLAALLARDVLPEQFLRDDAHLRSSMQAGASGADAAAFRDVATVYAALGWDAAPHLAALASMSLFVMGLLAAVGWARAMRLRVVDLLVSVAMLVPACAYLAQFTKETFSSAVVLLLLLAPTGPAVRGAEVEAVAPLRAARVPVLAGEALIIAGCAVYGAMLRPYWLIIAAAYPILRVVTARTAHPLLLLALAGGLYAVLQPLFHLVLGSGLQGQRDWANAQRAEVPVSVNSLITSVAPDATGWLGVAAALAMIGLIILPVPLLSAGTVYHMLAGAAITGTWLLVLVPLLRGQLRIAHASTAQVLSGAPDHRGVQARRAVALLLALLLLQALFEPDYGSVLKHLTPLLPLVIAVHLHGRRR